MESNIGPTTDAGHVGPDSVGRRWDRRVLAAFDHGGDAAYRLLGRVVDVRVDADPLGCRPRRIAEAATEAEVLQVSTYFLPGGRGQRRVVGRCAPAAAAGHNARGSWYGTRHDQQREQPEENLADRRGRVRLRRPDRNIRANV